MQCCMLHILYTLLSVSCNDALETPVVIIIIKKKSNRHNYRIVYLLVDMRSLYMHPCMHVINDCIVTSINN